MTIIVVHSDGYQWVKGVSLFDEKPTTILLQNKSNDGHYHGDRKPIEKYPNLYRKFAKLQPNKREIKVFANDYGLLGTNEKTIVVLPINSKGEENVVDGETISIWKKEIEKMRFAIELWDALINDDFKLLTKRIQWPDNSYVTYSNDTYDHPEKIIDDDDYKAFQKKYDIPHPHAGARIMLYSWINDYLQEYTYPNMYLDREEENERKLLKFQIGSIQLLGGLWLQLVGEITSAPGRIPRTCVMCGNSLGKNLNEKTCSDACRKNLERACKSGNGPCICSACSKVSCPNKLITS
jgi:hypothetical protein